MSAQLIKYNENPTENNGRNQPDSERFLVFIARGERALYSSSNYAGAERLAIIFANLTNTKMEVFDSLKEVCFYIDPFESNTTFVH